MKTINHIHLKNFQSHSDSRLEFLPTGVNAIVSEESAVGKSSIIRALRILAENKMRVATLKRGTKKTEIISGDIKRIRSKSINKYMVGEETYKAMGTSVPEPISEALNLTELNFRKQHEPYFLINDSPGQVAKKLNEVADLTLIDKTIAHLKADVKASKGAIEDLVEEEEVLEKEIEQLGWWEEAEKLLQKIEATNEQLIVVNRELPQMKEVRDRVTKLQKKVAEFPSINIEVIDEKIQQFKEFEVIAPWVRLSDSLKSLGDKVSAYPEINLVPLNQLLDQFKEVEDLQLLERLSKSIKERREDLAGIQGIGEDVAKTNSSLTALVTLQQEISKMEGVSYRIQKFQQVKQCNTEAARNDITDIEYVLNEKQVEDKELDAMMKLADSIKRSRDRAAGLQEQVQETKNLYDQALKELGVCPTCGGEV